MSRDTAGAPVVERLRAIPPQARAVAVRKLSERGLLATLETPPARLPSPSDALTCKQRTLWTLDGDGGHGDFYHCGALWFAPSVPPADLGAAYLAAAGDFDALGRVVDDSTGEPRSRRAAVPVPTTVTVPSGVGDPHGWVRRAASTAASGVLDPTRQAAEVIVYAMPDGSSALAVLAHDLHLDHPGLMQILGPAIAARLTGAEPVAEEVRITDFAAWQRQRLDDGVLGVAVASRRDALRGALAGGCPWPTGGDRAGRRIDILAGDRAGDALRDAAARAGVSTATVVFAAWYRALAGWHPPASTAPIGCCTTARVRPELRATLGNLTNTVIIAPERRWSMLDLPELLAESHRAMKAALGSIDLPFELVFGDGLVQDEQIGVRFTFVEDPPADGESPLRPDAVPFRYAKSVLSCEVHLTGQGVLRVWLDYRPAYLTQQAADQLAAGFRRELRTRR